MKEAAIIAALEVLVESLTEQRDAFKAAHSAIKAAHDDVVNERDAAIEALFRQSLNAVWHSCDVKPAKEGIYLCLNYDGSQTCRLYEHDVWWFFGKGGWVPNNLFSYWAEVKPPDIVEARYCSVTDLQDLIKRLRFASVAGGSPLFDEAADALEAQANRIEKFDLATKRWEAEIERLAPFPGTLVEKNKEIERLRKALDEPDDENIKITEVPR
jgi:hypothetical protein